MKRLILLYESTKIGKELQSLILLKKDKKRYSSENARVSKEFKYIIGVTVVLLVAPGLLAQALLGLLV